MINIGRALIEIHLKMNDTIIINKYEVALKQRKYRGDRIKTKQVCLSQQEYATWLTRRTGLHDFVGE